MMQRKTLPSLLFKDWYTHTHTQKKYFSLKSVIQHFCLKIIQNHKSSSDGHVRKYLESVFRCATKVCLFLSLCLELGRNRLPHAPSTVSWNGSHTPAISTRHAPHLQPSRSVVYHSLVFGVAKDLIVKPTRNTTN